jgi:hypothetical protein
MCSFFVNGNLLDPSAKECRAVRGGEFKLEPPPGLIEATGSTGAGKSLNVVRFVDFFQSMVSLNCLLTRSEVR